MITSTSIIDVSADTVPAVTAQTYGETIEAIAAAGERYAILTADTPEGYEAVRLAIADCRTHRTAIEATRKELKSGPLEWGRRIDAVARDLVTRLEAIEEPLKAKKAEVDNAKAAARAEKARLEREAVEAQIRAQREAEEEAARLARAAEEQRLAVERERLAQERARMDAERAETDRLAKIERDRQAAEAAQLRADRAELDRIRRESEIAEAKKQAAEEAERTRAENERKRAEEHAAHLARLETLRPDSDKLHGLAALVRALPEPEVRSPEARAVLDATFAEPYRVAEVLEAFGR